MERFDLSWGLISVFYMLIAAGHPWTFSLDSGAMFHCFLIVKLSRYSVAYCSSVQFIRLTAQDIWVLDLRVAML